jgi:peptide/nickel transport system substrate-binding protein
MDALDDYTLKIFLRRPDAEADTPDLRWFWPLPRHILQETYETDKKRFVEHPYWTTKYVGLGPYKLSRFVPGSHLELAANQEYVRGTPKISKIVIRFLRDRNVLVSELLAGTVHMTLNGEPSDGALSMEDGVILAKRWTKTGEGKVIFYPFRVALLAVQMNPEFQGNKALGDIQVRKALVHSIDREALVKQLYPGVSEVAHAWRPSNAPDSAPYKKRMIKYDYDPAKAEQLFAEAGWTKGPDGMLRNAGGEKFELEVRALAGYKDPLIIVADYWKRAGLDVKLLFVPEARENENEWMAKFPGIRSHYMVAGPVGGGYRRYSCRRVASPANRWLQQSTNPAGYCNKEAEAQIELAEQALPFSAREAPFVELQYLALRDLPYIPLYFLSEVVPVRSAVSGIHAVPPGNRGRVGMTVHNWDIVK